MNTRHQWQSPSNISEIQYKLSLTMTESQELLKRLRRSIKESNEFNKRAQEYVITSRKITSLSLHNSLMSTAHIIKDVPQEALEK